MYSFIHSLTDLFISFFFSFYSYFLIFLLDLFDIFTEGEIYLESLCYYNSTCSRVLRGKVFGTPTPYCPVIFCPDPDRTEK